MKQIILYEFFENIRNKWIFIYSFLFFILCSLILYFGSGQSARAVASLLNLILLIIPLFSMLFGSLSFHESLPFMEMILIRPVSRFKLYLGKWLGISLSLNTGFLLGSVVSSVLFMNFSDSSSLSFLLLLIFGVLLGFIFTCISFLIATVFKKKEVSLIVSLAVWFYFYLIYDLLMLFFSIQFHDYPLEYPILGFILLNPIDLIRIVVLLNMEVGSLMGFSAAFFLKLFGNLSGIFIATITLFIWIGIPFLFGYRIFSKKDM